MDDDDSVVDDDDTVVDDDDTVVDDDDTVVDDDDTVVDDDDTVVDDDDTVVDDDDATPPVCAEDLYEDNDTQGGAALASASSYTGLRACPSDEDWYATLVLGGETITVDLGFDVAEGDLNLYLYDAGGSLLDASTGSGATEMVTYTASTPGNYYTQVVLAADAGIDLGATYSMDITVSAPSVCTTDSAEPNDSLGAASAITAGTTTGLTACPTDTDWYSFSASTGQTIAVAVAFPHAEGNIDANLYDSTGGLLIGASSVTDDESISWVVATGGTFLLEVSLTADTGSVPGNDYEVTLSLGSASSCTTDSYEPNDSIGAAVLIASPSSPGITACPTDSDWFELDVGPNEVQFINALFSHSEGNIDTYLYDAAGLLLESATSTTDDEDIVYTTVVGGSLFLEVVLTADAGVVPGNVYEVELSKTQVCSADPYEPNDDASSATTLSPPFSEVNLTLCDLTEEDWYELPGLVITDVIELDAVYEPSMGNVDFHLYDPTDTVVASSTESTGFESIFQYVATGGTWMIQVVMDTDDPPDGAFYDMNVLISTAPSTCVADPLEPNDSSGAAVAIGPMTQLGLTICPTDSDWYTFTASSGDTIDFDLNFSHGEGDIDLALYDPSLVLLDSSTSADDDEQIIWPATTSGDYYVEVSLGTDYGGIPGNFYDMELQGTTATCVTDSFEPNDSSAAASAVTPGIYTSNTVCPTDGDWYEFSANALETVTVDVGFFHDEGNVDAWLWDDAAATVLATGDSETNNEQLTYLVPVTGTFLLEVDLTSDAGVIPGNWYDLEINAQNSSACPADVFEPNDSLASPWPLPLGVSPGLNVCELEPDFLAFTGYPGYEIDILVDFLAAEGDIDLNLYDPDGVIVADATGASAPESITMNASMDGEYVLEVWLETDLGASVGTDYSVELELTPGVCVDDAYEPNEGAGGAYLLTAPGAFPGLTACYDVDDWYYYELVTGQTIEVDITFPHDEGDLNLALYDGVSNPLQLSESETDDESVTHTATYDGVYFIVVNLVGDAGPNAGNVYDMVVSIY